jgi:methyltransferase-like protein/trans-aconitate methyltransferase
VGATDDSSYDQIPYSSLAFPQTHPDRLAAIARIFRLSPPKVATCRVLELGCAGGGNLVPMSVNLPAAEFVGVDTSTRQVAEARATIRALGVRNARVEPASILDIDESWGTFDYIICHGVFSWVDEAVQDRILEIADRNLAADGIAYVSYNTYPGWHMRDMVRQMMRYHAAQFAEPREQVEQARALLSFLASAVPDTGPYNQLLAAEADRASRAPDSYLFHEHLERTNLPIYFHQFIARAERVHLQYLAEAEVSGMLTTHFPAAVAETLERISPDLLHIEQYMDFIRNRQFRQTLLCHEAVRPVRALSPDVLHGLLLSSSAVAESPSVDLAAGTAVGFTNGKQRAEVTKPSTKAAMLILRESWPCAIETDVLTELALDRAAPHLGDAPADEARRGMLEDLFGGVMYGLVELHTEPPPCTNRVSDHPRAHPVAAYQAESGTLVVNAHHQMLDLDPFSIEVLRLSDGRRGHGEIADALGHEVESGRLEQALAGLVRNALLVE